MTQKTKIAYPKNRSGKGRRSQLMRETKIKYPRQKVVVLEQNSDAKTVQNSSFGGNSNQKIDLVEENEKLNQQIDELENQKDLGLLGGSESSGGGQQTGDLEEMQEQIDQNTEDIASLQQYMVVPDPNYTGRTPSDYQSGTIFQTYDVDEKFWNISQTTTSSISLTLPKICFSAEPESAGTIKLEVDFKLQTTLTTLLFTIQLNGTDISQEVVTVDALDTVQTYQKTFFDQTLNTLDRGNVLSIIIGVQNSSGSKTLVCARQKVEVIAPNVEIITKNVPFDAIEIDGTYYLSDSTSGTAKTANIRAIDINNISNVTWTNTNIDAQRYWTTCSFVDYGSTKIVDKLCYAYWSKENRFVSVVPQNDYVKTLNSSVVWMDFRADPTSQYILFNTIYSSGKIQILGHHSDSNQSYSTGGASGTAVKIAGPRYVINYFSMSSLPIPCISISQNGMATLWYQYSGNGAYYRQDIGYCSDATLYVSQATNKELFTVKCYLKRYDKIIEKVYSHNYSQFVFVSEQEIGKFDKFFLMPNNDYFAVKNNQISYHKLPTT